SIEFSGAVTIGNTKVPQGKYGFYLIPNESEPWVAILNTDWNRDEPYWFIWQFRVIQIEH
ncbi:MAG: DUF2911 domain-containing protein, partial [Cyanobacteria bacterium P01_A01_bin.83]